jgi:hypothetical protein
VLVHRVGRHRLRRLVPQAQNARRPRRVRAPQTRAGRAQGGAVLPARPIAYDRYDLAAQKELVAEQFADAGWQVPRLLTAMRSATDFGFDSYAQVSCRRGHAAAATGRSAGRRECRSRAGSSQIRRALPLVIDDDTDWTLGTRWTKSW